jgi:coenzyme Q-binding protein COQ10
MPMFRTTRHVAHSPERMFALVADVEQYPQFLPLCEALTVRRRDLRDDGTELVVATMRVGYKAISESFTSRITLDAAASRILVEYVDGPFRHLENRWTFTPDGKGGCDVGFFITYEFASRTLGLLMGAMFDRAFRKFAEAFEARADQIYR